MRRPIVEHPAHRSAPPEPERYHTIAQFYEAILQAIDQLCRDPSVWAGDPAFQVGPGTYYYGGGGDAVVVTDLASAADALDVIVNEGEGMPGSIFEDDVLPEELAHYFRFEELSCGRRYVRGDTPSSGPTGPPILLDYDSVLPMGPNPKAYGFLGAGGQTGIVDPGARVGFAYASNRMDPAIGLGERVTRLIEATFAAVY